MSSNSSMCVAVTGAAGFIASHTVQALLEAGHRVHGTVRKLSDEAKRAHLDAMAERHPDQLTLFEADLLDEGSFDDALAGCDAVIHMATAAIFTAKDPQRQIVDVAVNGTKNVLGSVERVGGIRRVVMTSSLSAIMSWGRPGDPTFDENDWCDSDDVSVDPYGIAKTASERLLWSFAERRAGATDMIAINPGVAYGPPLARHHVKTSVSMIRKLITGAYPAVPRIRIWPIDARDIALAHVRALRSESAKGHRIILANEPFWIRDISAALRPKYDAPLKTLPKLLVYAAATFDKSISVKYMRAVLDYDYGFRSERAREMLDMTYRDPRNTILATADTMVERGWVKL